MFQMHPFYTLSIELMIHTDAGQRILFDLKRRLERKPSRNYKKSTTVDTYQIMPDYPRNLSHTSFR